MSCLFVGDVFISQVDMILMLTMLKSVEWNNLSDCLRLHHMAYGHGMPVSFGIKRNHP